MNTIAAASPMAILAGAALLVLLVEVVFGERSRRASGPIAFFALASAAALGVFSWGKGRVTFNGALVLDNAAIVFVMLLAGAGLLIVLSGPGHVERRKIDAGAYHALLLLAFAGLTIMVSSPDLLVVFLGLEVFSIAGYALAGIDRADPRSTEAAVKYFMNGSLASAFLIFGLAFLYGGAGSLDIPTVQAALRGPSAARWAVPVGLGLVVVGFAFKIALAPFHMWAPDVYEGAPTPVTALFATAPKAAGFAALLRLFGTSAGDGARSGAFGKGLWAIAALTMVWAGLSALRQTNLKRLLAYSSVAHSGFLLIAVLDGDGPGLAFYLAVYLVMNIGAFGAIMALSGKDGERLDLDAYAGLGYRSPWIAAMLSLFLLSLAGFPPTAGFMAKFLIFSTAVDRGLIGLVGIALLASLISVYYYLRVVVVMYMRPPLPGPGPELDDGRPALFLVIFLCFYAVLQLGIMPGNLLALIRQAF